MNIENRKSNIERPTSNNDSTVNLRGIRSGSINRTSSVDVGSLPLKYSGGGHRQVGTCQGPYETADDVLIDLLKLIDTT